MDSPAETRSPREGTVDILAGAGLGIAVGVLTGMSTSPVVAIVVSALVALVATFFGLSSQAAEGAKMLRIAGFGLALPIAIFAGVAARMHSWLAPSLTQQTARWTAAGYTPDQARAYVAFHELGLVPANLKVAEAPKAASTGLMDDDKATECGLLDESRFPDPVNRLDAMRNAGGGWKSLADSLSFPGSTIDTARLGSIVDAAFHLACQ